MSESYMIAVAAFLLGVLVSKDMKAAAKDTTTHNEVSTSGDWWSYAGMWRAG